MTDRQEKFCLEYVRCGNATEAYRSAGYNPKSAHAAEVRGSALLRNVEVKAKIAELRGQLEDEKIMDAKARRERLTEIAKGKSPIVAIKAIDVLNKMDGVYINKTQLTGEGGGPLTIAWESADDGK